MPPSRKLFTIALPVRNGGRYLRPCVESILGQSCGDFDLVILDNHCDDEGAEWLATVRDPRMTIQRSDRVLGIEDNWARIVQIPKNEYLTMIGHDDLLDANYLEEMRQLVLQHPEAGLYQAHFRLIDDQGRLWRHCYPMPLRETAAEFLAARLDGIRDSFGTGYLMRSRDFDRVGGLPRFARLIHSDDALWLRLMENSWKATSPQELFSYRYHAQSTSGGLDPAIYVDVLTQYQPYVEAIAKRDPVLDVLLARYGPGFYARQGEYLHQLSLRFSLEGNRPYPAALRARLPAWLEGAEAAGLPAPNRGKKIRLLEVCLRHSLSRRAYRIGRSLVKTLWDLVAPLLTRRRP